MRIKRSCRRIRNLPNKRSEKGGRYCRLFSKRGPAGIPQIEMLMEKYLEYWGVKFRPGFAEEYIKKVIELSAKKNVALPHNLGTIGIVEHEFDIYRFRRTERDKKIKEHILKYGMKDYTMLWRLDPLMLHQVVQWCPGGAKRGRPEEKYTRLIRE